MAFLQNALLAGCSLLLRAVSGEVSDTNNHRIQRFEPGERRGAGDVSLLQMWGGRTVAGSAEGKSGDSLAELCMPTGRGGRLN